jgi:tRNA (guanine-N7-)-methyltransferase
VSIDQEFGVPFPGAMVARELWTQTGIKRLPATGQLNWQELFVRSAPIVLDVGCGNGRYLIGSALRRPDHDHFGLDILPVVIRYATRRANQRGLDNVRFTVGHGRDFLQRLVPRQSVAELHLYHPQPYYDLALVNRRLITSEFLVLVHRSLKPNGLFVVQTDNPGYWNYISQLVPMFFEWENLAEPWPDAPTGRTRREIIALQHGLEIYRGCGRARVDLNEAEVRQLAERLPPPIFNADRRLRDLDRIA